MSGLRVFSQVVVITCVVSVMALSAIGQETSNQDAAVSNNASMKIDQLLGFAVEGDSPAAPIADPTVSRADYQLQRLPMTSIKQVDFQEPVLDRQQKARRTNDGWVSASEPDCDGVFRRQMNAQARRAEETVLEYPDNSHCEFSPDAEPNIAAQREHHAHRIDVADSLQSEIFISPNSLTVPASYQEQESQATMQDTPEAQSPTIEMTPAPAATAPAETAVDIEPLITDEPEMSEKQPTKISAPSEIIPDAVISSPIRRTPPATEQLADESEPQIDEAQVEQKRQSPPTLDYLSEDDLLPPMQPGVPTRANPRDRVIINSPTLGRAFTDPANEPIEYGPASQSPNLEYKPLDIEKTLEIETPEPVVIDCGTPSCQNQCCPEDPFCRCGVGDAFKLLTRPQAGYQDWPTSRITIGGWVDAGWMWNPDNPTNGSNAPVLFSDRADAFGVRQLYLFAERKIACTNTWDIGGRVDLLYGMDAYYYTANGLETWGNGMPRWNKTSRVTGRGAGNQWYGLAMPQLYAEIGTPWLGGFTVKMGHFYSPIGFESLMAPAQTFISRSYTRSLGEPLTHTGILAKKTINCSNDIYLGMTRGWDNWEDPHHTLAILAGFQRRFYHNRSSLGFMIHSGDDNGGDNRTIYSLTFDHRFTQRLRYSLEHALGVEKNGAQAGNRWDDANWASIVQYLHYDLGPKLSLAARVEWFYDPDYNRIFQTQVDSDNFSGGNVMGYTLGLNWQPIPRATIRSEIRWDQSNIRGNHASNIAGLYNNRSSTNQLTAGLDFIFCF